MIQNRKLELITLVAVLGFIIVFLIVNATGSYAFGGSDQAGSQKVAELTGHSVNSFTPLIPQWVPPSTEIESTLFAIQTAIGGVVLGFVFGYWFAQKKQIPAR
jgi:cobalt/nickel transport protein